MAETYRRWRLEIDGLAEADIETLHADGLKAEPKLYEQTSALFDALPGEWHRGTDHLALFAESLDGDLRHVISIVWDEGWLLTWVHRPEDGCSDFVVLDAQTLEPAYTAMLPVNAGFTFHGCFVDN